MTQVYPSYVCVPIQASTFAYDPKAIMSNAAFTHLIITPMWSGCVCIHFIMHFVHSLHHAFCECICVSVQSSHTLPVIYFCKISFAIETVCPFTDLLQTYTFDTTCFPKFMSDTVC